MSQNHDTLINNQQELHGRIARAVDNLRKLGSAKITTSAIEIRINQLDTNWAKFEKAHDQLREEYWEQVKTHAYITKDYYAIVEEVYYNQRATLEEMMLTLSPSAGSSKTPESPRSSEPLRSQLPRLQLPTFSGRFEDWPNFKDLFQSMVGADSSLQEIQKFHYLRSSLKGEAEQLTRNIPTTAGNYERVWTMLQEHYENKRLLVRSVLTSFSNLPKMKGESAFELRKIFNGMLQTVAALEGIQRPVAENDLFVHRIIELFDSYTRKEWESVIGNTTDPPCYEELRLFMENRLRTLEAIQPTGRDLSSKTTSGFRATRALVSNPAPLQSGGKPNTCFLCHGQHYILGCPEFKRKEPNARKEFAIEHRLCFNCFGNHRNDLCPSTRTCYHCKDRHHTTIHEACSTGSMRTRVNASAAERRTTGPRAIEHRASEEFNASSSRNINTGTAPPKYSEAAEKSAGTSTEGAVALHLRNIIERKRVLLATARVFVTDKFGKKHTVRALIDPGSEVSLASESLMQKLKLPRFSDSTPIFGIGGIINMHARGKVIFKIESGTKTPFSLQITALILSRLTASGVSLENMYNEWQHLSGLELADPDFRASFNIELILGAEVYAIILEEGIRKGNINAPIAIKTALGWVLSGTAGGESTGKGVSVHKCTTGIDLSDLVKQFWQQEEIKLSLPALTAEEIECEKHFVETHRRDETGRYIIRLPFLSKDAIPNFKNSRSIAVKMLQALEKRLSKQPQIRKLYNEFMTEYQQLEHMTKVTSPAPTDEVCCYLPHHCVIKSAEEKTKIRVVCNGSARMAQNISLNQVLLTGKNLLPELPAIITNWRRHRFAIVADIEKMYRQILVDDADKKMQRIVWRYDPAENVNDYQLNTLTYGLACAPFVALRVLQQLAEDEKEKYPIGASVLQSETYMDDILTGASSVNGKRALIKDLVAICMAGGFPLKKWAASSKLIEDIIPKTEHQNQPVVWQSIEGHPILGMQWNPRTDTFAFHIHIIAEKIYSKRKILSEVAQLFDPLGWLAPVIIRAKIFIQTLWLKSLDWDEPLPKEEQEFWLKFQAELPELQKIALPRWINSLASNCSIEIHGFSDASERAIAAVVYLRVTCTSPDEYDDFHFSKISLLQSKTKVAPLKTISLPRLELNAAALLVRLVNKIKLAAKFKINRVYLWSDSTVTLAWIRGHSSRWSTYVANRVTEIQETLPDAQWKHVSGNENPADCASRGISPSELAGHPLWWTGPAWLSPYDELNARLFHQEIPRTHEEERPARVHIVENKKQENEMLLQFSSLTRLLHITAWCRRWPARLRKRKNQDQDLELSELEDAKNLWIKHSQDIFFSKEIKAIKNKQTLLRQSALYKLNPFVDKNEILRVGGRLQHSSINYNQKHPIILSKDSYFAKLVIDKCHRMTLHGGVQLTLATIRQRYWILGGRQIVKSFIHKCAKCIRWKGTACFPLMGSLPHARTSPLPPFFNTGLDYAGPIMMRTSKGRGQRAYKGFIAIFVCFSTRAVHIEAVSDYTTEAFLAAFRRFTSRRGLCAHLYSDRGTNFIGADAQLRNFIKQITHDSLIKNNLTNKGVLWHFNPPSAPHFGGLWEAAVKSAKFHIHRVIGKATLTYEELATFLTQVEACLNSRPLLPISDDPEDFEALTPGHFLIGQPLNALPEPSLQEISENRLKRWQLIQKMRDHFWQRWSNEYIPTLNVRNKWSVAMKNLKINTLCLIRGEGTAPAKWPLGRIIAIHPGADGQVRVVTVKTATTTFTRPVVKIVPLFADNEINHDSNATET
ncbi:uncharacterized protein [Cardiocondyla obscurior]|uniref:uncharacterized protein n=1 Tax=Cardiocondyla obscurior TaxID=286306 RepID=UPI003965739B